MDAPKRITQNGVEYEATGEFRLVEKDELYYAGDLPHAIRPACYTWGPDLGERHIYRRVEPSESVKVGDVFRWLSPGVNMIVRELAKHKTDYCRCEHEATKRQEHWELFYDESLLDKTRFERLPAMPVEVGQVWKWKTDKYITVIITSRNDWFVGFNYLSGVTGSGLKTEDFLKTFTFHGWARGEKGSAQYIPTDNMKTTFVIPDCILENNSLRAQLAECNADNEAKEKTIERQFKAGVEADKEIDRLDKRVEELTKERDDARARVAKLETRYLQFIGVNTEYNRKFKDVIGGK